MDNVRGEKHLEKSQRGLGNGYKYNTVTEFYSI